MFLDLYSFSNCFELLYINEQLCCGKINRQMERNEYLKLHRGVDNEVYFTVRNRDYKKVDILHLRVRCKLIDPVNGEVLLNKYAEVGSCKGEIKLIVFEGDLTNIPPGYYNLVVQGEKNYISNIPDLVVASPFYSNQAHDIIIDVEVTNQANSYPRPSIEINESQFLPFNSEEQRLKYYTPAGPCNAIRNHKNSVHTFVLYSQEFTGKVEVYGSLDINPPMNISDYFLVDLLPGVTHINLENFSGVDAFVIQSNLVWVRFVIYYDEIVPLENNGSIIKIVWRS